MLYCEKYVYCEKQVRHITVCTLVLSTLKLQMNTINRVNIIIQKKLSSFYLTTAFSEFFAYLI